MPESSHVMLTVLLHHDQSKTLDEIMAHLRKTGFYRDFPPEGSELVSWVVAMSFSKSSTTSLNVRPRTGSPPMPTIVDCPMPEAVRADATSYVRVPLRETSPTGPGLVMR